MFVSNSLKALAAVQMVSATAGRNSVRPNSRLIGMHSENLFAQEPSSTRLPDPYERNNVSITLDRRTGSYRASDEAERLARNSHSQD
jgi:hypothetical protein